MAEEKTKIEKPAVKAGPTKDRSPNYPVIGLEKAVERTKALYDAFKRNFVAASLARQEWGYNEKSGLGRQTVAALKAFGLIESRGLGENQEVKISEDAYDVLILNSPKKAQILRSFALRPAIHQKIWERYQAEGLPNDAALQYFLTKEVGFNVESVGTFIDQFKATLAYAKVSQDATDSTEQTDSLEENHEDKPLEESKERNPGLKVVTTGAEIPLFLDHGKFVKIPYPLTEDDFDLLITQLNSLKGRLVKKPDPSASVS